jgi:uncharacterized protein YndB with AHSA1/START domain
MNITLDLTKLQLVLDGETDIIIRRDFTHPPARVWRALTEPALIQKWLDGMKRCEMDLRPGGSFRYEFDAFYFSGTILTVEAPNHMTHVEHFSADPSYQVEITTDLVPCGTGTRMTQVMRYANAEARAAAIANGFTDGLDDVYGKLEAVVTAE